MSVDEILNRYYNNVTYKYCPEFDFNDPAIQEELISDYAAEYSVINIFEARPEYQDMLGYDGYNIVYHVLDNWDDSKTFIGITVGYTLSDVTSDIEDILNLPDDDESWNEDDMLARGESLYSDYGPDIDPSDLDEYDAECYLAYKRSI